MTRALSFGYNAAASVAELVVRRLVGALFEDGTIDSTLTSIINLSASQTATAQVHISSPAVELVVPNKPDRAGLSLQLHAVLDLPGSGGLGINDGDWIKARVILAPRLTMKGDKLCPDLASLTSADVSLENVSSNNPILQGLVPFFLKSELNRILGASSLAKLAVPFALDKAGLLSDSFDIRVADGPPPADRDELVFAAYDSKQAAATRGKPAAITPFLGAGKSLRVRVAEPTFSALLKEQIDTAYMRYDLKLGDKQAQQKRGISWGKPFLDLFGAGYYVWVSADTRRANLRNVTVTNLRTGEKRSFSTDKTGVGRFSVLESGIPVADLKTGDTLRFHGEYRYEQGTDIHYPTFTLGDGYIELAVRAVRDVACYDNVDVDLKVKLYISIDPATGAIQVTTGSPDIDMPWYVEAGVFFIKFFVSMFIGPFSGILFGDIESEITEAVSTQAQKQTGALLPSLPANKYMRAFWESIDLKSSGLIIGGQIEAGWLAGGGRQKGLILKVDSKDKEYQQLVLNTQQASAWLVRFDPQKQVSDWESRLALVTKTSTFEALDSSALRKLTANATDSSVKLPVEKGLPGTVLALRTAWGRLVKVRVDRSEDGIWVLRWISYYRGEADAGVEIVGAWKSDAKVIKSQMLIFTEVHKYAGSFDLKLTNLHAASGLKVKWTYSGPGSFKIVSADKRKVYVAVDVDELPGQTFSGTLAVEVEDIFGRKAKATRVLSGNKSWGTPGPGAEIAVSPADVIGDMHGPHPVALPGDPNDLIKQIDSRIARLEEVLHTIVEGK